MNIERVPAADLFKTEDFRRSPWIKELTGKVGEVWTTKHVMPPGHFGTYFGAVPVRAYDNPYINDLFVLHELTHVATLKYGAGRTWLEWSRDMINSELEASLASECWAYLHIPDLRKKTFKHEIWIDRYLGRHDPNQGTFGPLERVIRTERIRAMNAPTFNDFLEAQINNYYQQNHAWCRVWAQPANAGPQTEKPAFRIVEQHMSSPDRDATHQSWIRIHTQIGEWTAPFLSQGKSFADIYRNSNAKFGNWLLTR
jgi:hypothetical protein